MKEEDFLTPKKVPARNEIEDLISIYQRKLIDTGAVIVKGVDEPPFELKSGAKSRIYADHALIGTDRDAFIGMVAGIYGLTSQEFSEYRVMNVDSKLSAQMVGAYSALFGIEQMVFKGDKLLEAEKGSRQQLTGQADNVAILDDVGTSGRTIIEARNVLPKEATVAAFVGLVREPDSFQEALKTHSISANWVVTLDEMLEENFSTFSPKQQETIRNERGVGK